MVVHFSTYLPTLLFHGAEKARECTCLCVKPTRMLAISFLCVHLFLQYYCVCIVPLCVCFSDFSDLFVKTILFSQGHEATTIAEACHGLEVPFI